MKKLSVILFAAALCVLISISAFAATEVSVVIDGTKLDFPLQKPVITPEGSTIVPLRAIFEALDASVDWDGDTKSVTSTKGDVTVKLAIGSKRLYKNGEVTELNSPAQLIKGTDENGNVTSYTMVPVRAISEAFGCKVDWDGKTKTVIITTGNVVVQAKPYTDLKGIVYDFDDGNDGWAGYNKTSPAVVENGQLVVTSIEGVNDPQISNTKINADTTKYDRLVIRFKYDNYGKEDKMCNIYFATDVTGAYNEAKNIKAYYEECYVDEEGYTWAEFALFRNENWRGICTSLRFDPASGGNGKYIIDKIVLVEAENTGSAQQPEAEDKTDATQNEQQQNTQNNTPNVVGNIGSYSNVTGTVYDFKTDHEGWKGYDKACTSVVENGHLKVTSVEGVNDPQISKTALSVDTSKYDRIIIRFKYDNYGKEDKVCNIYFATDVTGGFNEAKNIKAYYNECYVDDEGYTWAEFALFRNENWRGICTSLRFDPASGGNGQYLIDKIIIAEKTDSSAAKPSVVPSQSSVSGGTSSPAKIETLDDCKNASGVVFNFDSNDEGWKAHTKMLTSEVSDGKLVLKSVPDTNDPQLTKTGLSVSTADCKTILIKYKWTATGSSFSDLYFATDTEKNLSESKKIKGSFDSYIKDTDGYSWAVFDMSQNASWLSTCTTVRFDPIGAGNGEFLIDKIVFVTSQDAEETDMTDKKRLMLVGDSIAFEYGPYLMKMLEDEYVMYEKEGREIAAQNLDVAVGGNAGDSKNVVRFVKQMESEGRFNFDLFLFNCGLHDLKRNKPDRALQVPLADYESNLREVVAICKKNNVKAIFVDITPILDSRYGENAEFIRKNEDVIAYNEVALKVMKENDIPVIDLNAYTLSLGQLSQTMRDHAHYYTDIQQKQARYIADFILG